MDEKIDGNYIYEHYNGLIYKMIRKSVNVDEVEDCYQHTFMKILENLDQFKNYRAGFSTFMINAIKTGIRTFYWTEDKWRNRIDSIDIYEKTLTDDLEDDVFDSEIDWSIVEPKLLIDVYLSPYTKSEIREIFPTI